ncbi:hypothetical protein GGX14DRAFT_418779 [Mycena pura]|uniref:Uncharacterized protein n=1 Tax=Mycena pura TaxID=153505 RepID=A0AAD6YRV1_9AGAR|nr:hypothetical protein GGX14DRAFT_418779 [Mycena pura]
MASPQGQPSLAERVDIHKSCKSLETLLNVLNDYCEAAGAVVLLQKKLSKALRETASMKVTGEIASNAMNTSATIFEAMSDIDSKFAKIADKEYDGISAEVKKWFKKLAKEEKAHDDRISSANARIKQAGQIYEKKSKKNSRDSADEHARYINLISSLGPEISQDKYNHALQVTQRHITATYSVAACLSRVADAEWMRACEGVRRFSPTIGPLGEWRALCEGGWTGPLPLPLVDPDPDSQQPEQEIRGDDGTTYRNVNPTEVNTTYEPVQTPSLTPLSSPNVPRAVMQQTPPSSFDPPRPSIDPNSGSVRSLSAFPSPPTHFPIPTRQQSLQPGSASSSTSNSNLNFPVMPQAELSLLEPDRQVEEPSSIPSSPNRPFAENNSAPTRPTAAPLPQDNLKISRPVPVRSHTEESYQSDFSPVPSPSAPGSGTFRQFSRRDHPADERNFAPGPKAQPDVSDTMQSTSGVQRSDTGGSTGSVVAAMRSRYSATSGTTSPPPKDMPRLPLSVSNLATRYQPVDSMHVSRTRAASPPVLSSLPSLQTSSPDRYRQAETSFGDRNTPGGYSPARILLGSSTAEESVQRRNQQLDQRLDEVAELEFLEKERALQEKELEIVLRAKQLEQERANLRNMLADSTQREAWDNGTASPKPQLRPRERKTSFRNTSPLPRPQSQLETRVQPSYVGNNQAHSYSTNHLVPPSLSQPSPRSSTSSADSAQSSSQHAPYCGCETCSIAQYKMPSNRAPSPHDLRPPEKPLILRPTEKPKGWIRRLSMPVGNAFSLEKKNSSKMYSLDAGKRGANGSATTLRNVDEEGRMIGRRSYEASAVGNRSMTNLVGAGVRR